MGLLSQGSPLSWEKTQRHAEHVRKHGIQQFLNIYRAVGERHKDVLKWGDEIFIHYEFNMNKMNLYEKSDIQVNVKPILSEVKGVLGSFAGNILSDLKSNTT